MAIEKKTKQNLPEKYQLVADNISVGKENSILLSDIISIADISDRRHAYQIIEDLINYYGFVIGAKKSGQYKGYYKPANEAEFQEITATFKQSINSMIRRYNNLVINFSDES